MSEKKNTEKVEVPQYQVNYANLLLYGSWIGMAFLAVAFFLYVLGIMPGYIDPAEMPQYWTMESSKFLKEVGLNGGWEWLGMLGNGDFFNLLGIAFLAGLTIIAYIVHLLPAFWKQKNNAYLAIVVTEILVLVLAASGLLGSGGH